MERLVAVVGSAWASSLRSLSSLRRGTMGGLGERHDREGGQGLAEYALILSLIAIVVIAALTFFGVQLSSLLTDPVGQDIGGVMSQMIGP